MEYLRGFVVAALLSFAGAGGAVIALNFHTDSPRLMGGGIACAIIGIAGGGLLLGRIFERLGQGGARRPQFDQDFPPQRRL